MQAQYRILYSGNLAPDQDLEEVAARLAKTFKMKHKTARQLIEKGAGRVLKHNLSAESAERYRAALSAVGLVITIEPQDSGLMDDDNDNDNESLLRPYQMSETTAPGSAATTLGVALGKEAVKRAPQGDTGSEVDTSGWGQCPKCGARAVSDLTGVCQACGVVAERYLANHGGAPAPATSSARDGVSAAVSPNPYAPPRADLTPPAGHAGGDQLHPPRAVAIGRGWGWILDAWEIFRASPGAWIGALALFYLIMIALGLIPLVGGLVTTVLGPMLAGGLMLGAHAQFQGDRFTVAQLFRGFTEKPGPLALVGLAYLLMAIGVALVIGLLLIAALGASGFFTSGAFSGNDADVLQGAAFGPALVLPFLFGLLLAVPVAMAVFFAAPLVAIDGVPILTAFKLSLLACLRNILPFLVFGLIALALFVLGSLPLLLGLLIVVPVLTISVYSAYRDIFYG